MVKEKDRKLAFAYVTGELLGEGMNVKEDDLKKALRLNPKSIIEKAMQAKSQKELEKIANEVETAEQAFLKGYFEGMSKRKTLTDTEKQNLKRLQRLKASNDPLSMSIADTELKAFLVDLEARGICPDTIRKELAK